MKDCKVVGELIASKSERMWAVSSKEWKLNSSKDCIQDPACW